VTGERHIDRSGQLECAAPGEFELLKACFQEDHDALPAVGGGGHPGGVVHDDTASA
jgi:hypothetical protein